MGNLYTCENYITVYNEHLAGDVLEGSFNSANVNTVEDVFFHLDGQTTQLVKTSGDEFGYTGQFKYLMGAGSAGGGGNNPTNFSRSISTSFDSEGRPLQKIGTHRAEFFENTQSCCLFRSDGVIKPLYVWVRDTDEEFTITFPENRVFSAVHLMEGRVSIKNIPIEEKSFFVIQQDSSVTIAPEISSKILIFAEV